MTIRGVLLDSGDTLIGPKGGRWNPRHDFEATVLAWWPDAPVERFPSVFAIGDELLSQERTSTRRDYHLVLLRELGIDRAPEGLLEALEVPLPAADLVEPFEDVPVALEALHGVGARMALVTDNWSTIRQLYQDLGLARFFDAFVISEELGCAKPDPRMYKAGSDALGLAPAECVFIDDDPDLVAAALDLGYHAFAVDRSARLTGCGVPTIRSLPEVVPIVGA
jgi:putative hydrolase of the HAD superfamily